MGRPSATGASATGTTAPTRPASSSASDSEPIVFARQLTRFLEWFCICLRHGWIKENTVKLNTREPRLRNGEDRRLAMLRGRRWQGLDLPYGPQAYALRLALDPGIPPPRPSPKK